MSHITEMFGLSPLDPGVKARLASGICPFVGGKCTKKNTGVCAVSNGASNTSVITCPNRLYGGEFSMLKAVSHSAFGDARLIMGDDKAIHEKLHSEDTPAVIAYGIHSSGEIKINSENGSVSFDWILQYFDSDHTYQEFVGVEFQSMDTTGNYRGTLDDIIEYHAGTNLLPLRQSEHGINWANVHKRLIPQLIRKGNIADTDKSRGLFFVLPEIVFQKFEEVLPGLSPTKDRGSHVLTVITVEPKSTEPSLNIVRTVSFKHQDVFLAFAHEGNDGSEKLSARLDSLAEKFWAPPKSVATFEALFS